MFSRSQVDQLWSILPAYYVILFAAARGFKDIRLDIMAFIISVWGARLTFNFAYVTINANVYSTIFSKNRHIRVYKYLPLFWLLMLVMTTNNRQLSISY